MSSAPADQRVVQFVNSMPREERMLVVLKRDLRGQLGRDDRRPQGRLEGRPYIIKLASRIAEDLERIERLREFERRARVDLSDYVKLEP